MLFVLFGSCIPQSNNHRQHAPDKKVREYPREGQRERKISGRVAWVHGWYSSTYVDVLSCVLIIAISNSNNNNDNNVSLHTSSFCNIYLFVEVSRNS
jgi:hypothetical protein